MSDDIKFDLSVGEPNWDLEIPLVMGAVDRGALAHRIRAWGAEQFAAGRAAALAELHPQWLAEKERADRMQAERNEAAFDKLLGPGPARFTDISKPRFGCDHEYVYQGTSGGGCDWRCQHCGAESWKP